MSDVAELRLDGKSYQLPVVEGTEKERAISIAVFPTRAQKANVDKTSLAQTGARAGNTWSVRDHVYGDRRSVIIAAALGKRDPNEQSLGAG